MVSFEEMFKRHAPKIRRVAVRLSRGFGGQQQVDELAAVGSVALWQCYQRFDAERMPEDAFWAYSNKRVQGAMLDTLRRQGHGGRAGQRMVKEDDLGDTPWALIRSVSLTALGDLPAPSDPEQDLLYKCKCELARKLVCKLPERHQCILRMSVIEGASLEEMGKRLGVSPDRISQIKADAIALLRLLANSS